MRKSIINTLKNVRPDVGEFMLGVGMVEVPTTNGVLYPELKDISGTPTEVEVQINRLIDEELAKGFRKAMIVTRGLHTDDEINWYGAFATVIGYN